MKYLTKEWFHLGDYLCEDAEVNPRAAAFSESYYRELYIQRFHDFLYPASEDDASGGEESMIQAWLDLRAMEYDQAKASIERLGVPTPVLEVDADQIPRAVYGSAEAYAQATFEAQVRSFDAQLMFMVHRLKERLPAEILDEVQDLRILALEECTEEVKDMLTDLAAREMDRYESLQETVEDAVTRAFGGEIPVAVAGLLISDHRMLTCTLAGDTLTLTFDPDDSSHPSVLSLRFRGVRMLQSEGAIDDAYLLQTEVYPTARGIEFHALVQSTDAFASGDGLRYLTLEASAFDVTVTPLWPGV